MNQRLARVKGADRPERRPVKLRGFALGDGRDSDVTLSDISYNGCRMHSLDRFSPGETVELRIVRRGLIKAKIRWASGGVAGAEFVAEAG